MAWILRSLEVIAILLVLAAVTEAALEARDRTRLPPPGRLVDIGGRKLHILCKGTAPGPTVIIEQGAGSPSMLWWPVQDRIAQFARVCSYDRAGYLWSDPAPGPSTLADRAADLHALLTGAEISGPYIFVAHSFGGPLVRLYAQQHPDRVAGMVLVDAPDSRVILAPAYVQYVRSINRFAAGLGAAARFGLLRAASLFLREIPPGLTQADYAALKSLCVRPSFLRAMAEDAQSLVSAPDVLNSLGKLGDMPLTVLAHGIAFPGPFAVLEDGWRAGQIRLAALSTHGTLIIAEHSNHMIQADEPDLVISAIARMHAAATPHG